MAPEVQSGGQAYEERLGADFKAFIAVLSRPRGGTDSRWRCTEDQAWTASAGASSPQHAHLPVRGSTTGTFFGDPYDRNAFQVERAGFDLIYRRNHPVPFQLQDGLPAGVLDNIPESELTPNLGARGTRFANFRVEFFGQRRETPYSHNMNLNLQARWKDWFFEFGVLANLGLQIAFPDTNLNRIRPEYFPRFHPDHPNAATELSGPTRRSPAAARTSPQWPPSGASRTLGWARSMPRGVFPTGSA